MEAYVKYQTFHLEQKKKFKEKIFRVENMAYDPERDAYTCPAGRQLVYIGTEKEITKNGYETKIRKYQCENCDDCVYRPKCTQAKDNRKISIRPTLEVSKEKARSNLLSDKGIELRKKSGVEVVSVFGQIKQSRGFRRFMLRGIKKVEIEWGLLSLAHNMIKLTNRMTEEKSTEYEKHYLAQTKRSEGLSKK